MKNSNNFFLFVMLCTAIGFLMIILGVMLEFVPDHSLRISRMQVHFILIGGIVLNRLPWLCDKIGSLIKSNGNTVYAIIAVVILAIMACIYFPAMQEDLHASNSSSRWDKLSDAEKEWYKDNYGNGQYNDIQDAIGKYKK